MNSHPVTFSSLFLSSVQTRSIPSKCRDANQCSLLFRRGAWQLLLVLSIGLFGSNIARANTYYLSTGGNDGNSGQSSSSSWLTPNHPLNCGDVIVAAAGQYNNANFYTGKWGTVTCAAGNSVAWLKCATFDACKIHATSNQGMWVDKSYWGVQGWEVTTTAADTYGTCFIAQPNYAHPIQIHHIIFANNVANGCAQTGFASVNHGSVGVDYLAILGNIAYDAVQGSKTCASGISVYQPVQSDTENGTHIYIAGNFSYANLEPSECNGGSPTDGEGIIFDAFDGSQSGLSAYWSQAVAYNNITIGNGSKGLEVNSNSAGSYHASIYLNQNTSWGDLTDPNQKWYGCAEISIYAAKDTHIHGNIASTDSATGCTGHDIYALAVSSGDSSDTADDNFAYGYDGNNTFLYNSGSFAYSSTNTLNESPHFENPKVPGAPSCSNAANVPACMATVVSDFVSSSATQAGYGYHKPSSTSVSDSLFPHWLCTANVPAGLVTMGCS